MTLRVLVVILLLSASLTASGCLQSEVPPAPAASEKPEPQETDRGEPVVTDESDEESGATAVAGGGPDPVTLHWPNDGAEDLEYPFDLQWTDHTNRDGLYTVHIRRADGSGLRHLEGCVDLVEWTCSVSEGLVRGETYEWSVRATRTDGIEDWSRSRVFTVGGSLEAFARTLWRENRVLHEAPLLTNPAQGAREVTHENAIAWRTYPLDGDVQYTVRALSGNGTLEICRTAEAQCPLPRMPAGEQLHVWVEVRVGDELAAVSTTRHVTYYAPPPPVELSAPPSGGAVHGGEAHLEWVPNADYGASDYVAFLSIDGGPYHEVCRTRAASCEAQVGLLKEASWYVESSDGRTTTRTPAWSFRTGGAPAKPVLEYPSDGAQEVPRVTMLRWTPLGDPTGEAVTYEAEVKRDGQWVRACRSLNGTCRYDAGFAEGPIRWRVKAVDASGLGALSDEGLYDPAEADVGFHDLFPVDGSLGVSNPVTFSWDVHAVLAGASYRVEYKIGSDPWETACTTTELSCVSEELPPGRSFVWRVSAEGHGGGRSAVHAAELKLPVVLLHGFTGDSSTWTAFAQELEQEGYDTLRTSYLPPSQTSHLPEVALVAQDLIEGMLADQGYPSEQRFHLIGHSMGGLVGRIWIEHQGKGVAWDAEANAWNPSDGRNLRDGYSARVASFTTVGTPHQGAAGCGIATVLLTFVDPIWSGVVCHDMTPGSSVLRTLGPAMHNRVPYYLIGGLGEFTSLLTFFTMCGPRTDGIVCLDSALHGRPTQEFTVTACHAKGLAVDLKCSGPALTLAEEAHSVLKQILRSFEQ